MKKRFLQQGLLLRSLREALGLSQKMLSEKLDLRTPQLVSNIERGYAGIPTKRVRDFAIALSCSEQIIADAIVHDFRTDILTPVEISA